MKGLKRHYFYTWYTVLDPYTECGREAEHCDCTKNIEEVTCKDCLKLLEKRNFGRKLES